MNAYRVSLVSFRVYDAFMAAREPFTVPELISKAKEYNQYFEETILAMTAEDALAMARINYGFGGQKLPFIVRIEAIEPSTTATSV